VLFGLADLPRRLRQVLLSDDLPVKDQSDSIKLFYGTLPIISNRKHTGLGYDIAQVSSIERVRKLQGNQNE
jgi:hypothetical protein